VLAAVSRQPQHRLAGDVSGGLPDSVRLSAEDNVEICFVEAHEGSVAGTGVIRDGWNSARDYHC
jgi:hypothetical protein